MKKNKIKRSGMLKIASNLNLFNAIMSMIVMSVLIVRGFLSHSSLYEAVFSWNTNVLVSLGVIIFPILLVITLGLILAYSITFSGCLVGFIGGIANYNTLGSVSRSEIIPYQYKGKRVAAIVSLVVSGIMMLLYVVALCGVKRTFDVVAENYRGGQLDLLKNVYIATIIVSAVITIVSLIITIVHMARNWRKTLKDENGKLLSPEMAKQRLSEQLQMDTSV